MHKDVHHLQALLMNFQVEGKCEQRYYEGGVDAILLSRPVTKVLKPLQVPLRLHQNLRLSSAISIPQHLQLEM